MSKQLTFEKAITPQRINRYYSACNNDANLAIMLYELNSYLSVSLFRTIGIFEVTFRNSIDKLYSDEIDKNWLTQAVNKGGMFNSPKCTESKKAINNVIDKLNKECRTHKRKAYFHNDIVCKLEFGFWKYQFAAPQYNAAGGILLKIFPSKPASNKVVKYNQKYFYGKLDYLNNFRNRIAHHEPICFQKYKSIIDITDAKHCVKEMCDLLMYMGLNHNHLIGDCEDMKFLIGKILQLQKIVNGKKTK